jgi:hypothetical protein
MICKLAPCNTGSGPAGASQGKRSSGNDDDAAVNRCRRDGGGGGSSDPSEERPASPENQPGSPLSCSREGEAATSDAAPAKLGGSGDASSNQTRRRGGCTESLTHQIIRSGHAASVTTGRGGTCSTPSPATPASKGMLNTRPLICCVASPPMHSLNDSPSAPGLARLAQAPEKQPYPQSAPRHMHHSIANSNLVRLVPGGSDGSNSGTTPKTRSLSPAPPAPQRVLVHPAAPKVAGVTMGGAVPPDVAAAFTMVGAAGTASAARISVPTNAQQQLSAGMQESAAVPSMLLAPSSLSTPAGAAKCVLDKDLLSWLQEQLPRPWRPKDSRSGSRSSHSTSATWQPEELLALLANPEMLRQGFTFEEASLVNIAQISAIKELHACCRNVELSGGCAAAVAANAAVAAAAALRTSPEAFVVHARALQDCRDSADSVGRAAANEASDVAQLRAVENALLGFQAAIGATSAHNTAVAAVAGAGEDDLGAAGGSGHPSGVGGAYAGAMGAAHMLPDGKLMMPWAPLGNVAQDTCPQESARDGIADTGSEVSNPRSSADECEQRRNVNNEGMGLSSQNVAAASERGSSNPFGKARSCIASTGPQGQHQGAFSGHRGTGPIKRVLSIADEVVAEEARQRKAGRRQAEGGGDNDKPPGMRVNLGGNH